MQKKKTLLLCMLLSMMLLVWQIPMAQASGITVLLNGQALATSPAPMLQNGRVLVPMRAIFQALGATVSWDASSRTVSAVKGSTSVSLVIGQSVATVETKASQLLGLWTTTNKQQAQLDVPAEIVGGSTMVPLRFVSQAFGAQVSWNGSTDQVAISTGSTSTGVTSTGVTTSGVTTSGVTTSGLTASGSITAAGSTALQPLVEQAADEFMQQDPNAKISVQGGGSGTGLSLISQGSINIGDSDLYAHDKLTTKQATGLVDHQVCVVGFAAVVNPGVGVSSLTNQQLIDIFTGKDTNWNQVGGTNMSIVIINRPSSSGTRFTFDKYALNGMQEAQGIALTEDSSGAVANAVANAPGSISYLAASYLASNNTIKAIDLNGVAPTNANIEDGKYPIWSYEHMYTKGAPTGLTAAFLNYMSSSSVASDINQLGYIPIADMQVSHSS